jgi:tripartite-type tricarboxylate transporter receptor subunit TctC
MRVGNRLVRCAALAGVVFSLAASSDGFAQPYPSRSVRFIVPYTAGGASDAVTRVLGQKLSELWNVPVVVENRGGAGGNIGTEAVARAAPDGYTILMGTVGTHGINASLYRKLPYDPVADFEPVSLVASTLSVLVVYPNLPVKSVRELIAYAAANPGKLNFGSSGNGTSHHLAGAMLNMLAKVKTTHVPYKGTAEMITGLLGGHIDMTFDPVVSILPHVKSGAVRALAVTSPERSPSLPDLPTMAESGVTGYDVRSWYGVLAPAKTSSDIVNRLNADFVKAVHLPDVSAKLNALGAPPIGSTAAELRAHIQRELKKWAIVVKESGAEIN